MRNSAGPAADELPKQVVGWVARTMGPGSRIQVVRRLPMGSWHLNHALTVVDGGGRVHRLVLRRWRLGWDRDDPDYNASREMTILDLLRPTPVPAPVLVGADLDGDECEVPTLLLSLLPGHPPTVADMAANRFCPDLAQALAVVHDAGRALSGQLAPYRLYYDRAEATPPRWLTNTRVWQQATAAVRATPPAARQAMIYRDFHPENTLWSGADSLESWTGPRPPGDRPGSTLATCGGTWYWMAASRSPIGSSPATRPSPEHPSTTSPIGISSACSTCYSISIQTTPAISTPTTSGI